MRKRHTYIAVHSDHLRKTSNAGRFDKISELFLGIVEMERKVMTVVCML